MLQQIEQLISNLIERSKETCHFSLLAWDDSGNHIAKSGDIGLSILDLLYLDSESIRLEILFRKF